MASTVHEYTTLPAMMTVHAPHVARSHTRLAPVSSSRSRNASHSVTRGSTFSFWAFPLMVNVIGTSPGPTGTGGAATASCSRTPLPSTPEVIPTPWKKPRREKPFLGAGFGSRSFLELTPHRPFRRLPTFEPTSPIGLSQAVYHRHNRRGSLPRSSLLEHGATLLKADPERPRRGGLRDS